MKKLAIRHESDSLLIINKFDVVSSNLYNHINQKLKDVNTVF